MSFLIILIITKDLRTFVIFLDKRKKWLFNVMPSSDSKSNYSLTNVNIMFLANGTL